MGRQTDMEFTHGSMGTDTKASSNSALSMARGWINLPMETHIRGSIAMESHMDMVSTIGPMLAHIKANSGMA